MNFNRSVCAVFASLAFLAAGTAGIGLSSTAHAMTAKECHAKFTAAKAGGTLGGQTYKAFKASQCTGAEAEAEEAGPASTSGATSGAAPVAPAAAERKTGTPAPVTAGSAVFPGTVSSKYASLSAGRARMKTCVDQYNANKATGGNGGLKWIQKGGGYYSQCNTRLKGG